METSSTPWVKVTQPLIDGLVGLGGYTHALFRPGPGGEPAPMPGQGVLLLMGGLVEQSGLLDDAIALLELRSVRFRKLLKAGSSLRVQLTPGASETTGSGKIVRRYRWVAVDDAGDHIAEAVAVMLMRPGGRQGAEG